MTMKEAIASLKKDAEHVASGTEEAELSNIAKRFIEAVEIVTAAAESPRPDWTTCAEGMNLPKDGVYDVTIKNKNGTRGVVTGYLVDGAWAHTGLYTSANIIAYMPKPAPYNPDRKEDA